MESTLTIRSRWGHLIFLVTALCMLVLPALVHVILPAQKTSRVEARVLAQPPTAWPPKNLSEISELTQQLDDYLNDHFGLRDQFVLSSNAFHYLLGRSSSANVRIGRNGWLFYAGGQTIEKATGKQVLPAERVQSVVGWYKRLAKRLDGFGTSLVVVIIPDKASIYPEKLPRWAQPDTAPQTNIELLERGLSNDSGITFINLKPTFLELKDKQRLYQPGDTHWTYLGAYQAYSRLVQLAGREPLPLDYFSLQLQPKQGDLQRMAGLPRSWAQDELTLEPPAEGWGHKVKTINDNERSWARTTIVQNPRSHGRVMMVGDSFLNYLKPLFRSTFGLSIFTYHHFGAFDWQLVEQHRPEVLYFEMAERYVTGAMRPVRETAATKTPGE